MRIKELLLKQKHTIPLLLAALIWNCLVYYGGNLLAKGAYHYNMELAIDRAMPFIPWTVSIYLGSFIFWAICYLICARQDKQQAYRFFCADFLAKGVCLLLFILLPATNIRPVVEDVSLWGRLMALLYQVDEPTNLFPSIHCLASWLCFIGMRRNKAIPCWWRCFSLLMALAICVSTLTTKQHVIVDVFAGVLLAESGYFLAGRANIRRLYARCVDRSLQKAPAHLLPRFRDEAK